MNFAYLLSGGTPVLKKYKTAAGHAEGIVVLVAAAGATGLSTSTTTSFADTVGVTVDAGGAMSQGSPATYSTTQGAVEFLQTVLISPDAVYKALLVSSAADAVLESRTVGTASSAGLTVVGTTGDTDPSSPDMDEGTVWYTAGANGGASRKITSTTTTLTVTVVMPFAANKVGDRYQTIGYTVGTKGVTMSTALKNVRGDIAATGADCRVVDMDLLGTGNSALYLVLGDNIFGSNT